MSTARMSNVTYVAYLCIMSLTSRVIYVALYDIFPHKCDLCRIAIRPNVYVALLYASLISLISS